MSPTDQVKEEIECYLSAPNLDVEVNPLLWWKVEGVHYPMLSKLARKYLVICATSSPSEHVFSSSGKTMTPLRANLKPGNVDKLVFLAKNL